MCDTSSAYLKAHDVPWEHQPHIERSLYGTPVHQYVAVNVVDCLRSQKPKRLEPVVEAVACLYQHLTERMA